MNCSWRLFPLLFALSGCVSINQGVQVDRPVEMNASQDVTKKCPLAPYVNRVFRTHCGAGAKIVSEGGRTVNTQADFDRYWVDLSLDPGQTLNASDPSSNKPLVDWAVQLVTFYSFKLNSTCERYLPAVVPMETDCLTVTTRITHFAFNKDCQPSSENVVFVFIYPKTALPMGLVWTDDPDKDGFTNESEIKVGTDPMDANSKP